MRKQALAIGCFHDPAAVHDNDVATALSDNGEVVADVQDRRPVTFLQVFELLQDQRAAAAIEGRGRFIRNNDRRFTHCCHCNHRQLAHATGQLVRVGGRNVFGLAEADAAERVEHGLTDMLFTAAEMTPVDRADLLPHGKDGIECSGGLLEYHRDVASEHGPSLTGIEVVYVPTVNLDSIGPETDSG